MGAMGVFWICAIGIVGSMSGFWFGRSLTWKLAEEGADADGRAVRRAEEDGNGGSTAVHRTEEDVNRGGAAVSAAEGADNIGAAVCPAAKAAEGASASGMPQKGFAPAALQRRGGLSGAVLEAGREASTRPAVYGVTRALPEPHSGKGRFGAFRHTGREQGKGRRGETAGLAPKCVAAPVSGRVEPFSGNGWIGALLDPEEGKLYAPASGKITRLYPMGSGFLLRTETGGELQVQVAAGCDEMCSPYFRSRVVQNEVVSRGKLLLEFDAEGLRKNGTEPFVSVCVRDLAGNVTLTHKDEVDVGENFLWVSAV